MKLKTFIIGLLVLSLTGCVKVWDRLDELKPLEAYAVENLNIQDKNAMDAQITLIDGRTVDTKIVGQKNIFYGILTETSITQHIPIYNNTGKKEYIYYPLVKEMRIKDYKGDTRIFVNRGPKSVSLQELFYDGKIKWFREYYKNSYDGSVQTTDHFVNGSQEINIGLLNSTKNKLKELTASKPELAQMIDSLSRFDRETVTAVLKEYEK
ncbi:hypothetical protein [Chryseobacterium sp.]|uniref:hypothetical protein n=1 Tax=Chryseobacterium sp. TaxID=1871047 RepID=UPI0011CA7269|nr:hypothetical protein [Chryseobacterium sp.]TXF74933.1 hypothetical protein FUA25_11645 [Chryseobacterium sp.]